ncbi:MAG TPA: leucyl aminopeptidase [Smithellaceae bacterium]|nr:leucyl aminopeptidase [Smithellaceae bacterium]HQF83561.1 leucyl aminopeptidase [Smithellaceae bacterium]HQG79545.1 leucyl aminopeptidase [Smithellaceae bacterium]
MKISVIRGVPDKINTEAVIVSLCEDERKVTGAVAAVDRETGGLLTQLIKNRDFEGKEGQLTSLYTGRGVPFRLVLLTGLGRKKELTPEKVRRAFAGAARQLRDLKVKRAILMPHWNLLNGRKSILAASIVEGVRLGLYKYLRYKTQEKDAKAMSGLELVCNQADYHLIASEVKKANIISDAVCFVRDLVWAPGNEMTPSILAAEARKIAAGKKLTCSVMGKDRLKSLGMNAFLAVAAGSHQTPRFIVLEYGGAKRGTPPVVLVGKGLTFDAGGISLKPSEKMDEMKMDMAGGAAVMAVAQAAAQLNLRLNLVCLIPATENMPGGGALKPGDIIKSYSGATIEIINTDAEGRLILADGLAYAAKFKPAAIIDIATLTGACIVALGEEVIGMFGTDEGLKEKIKKASEKTGELLWEMPLWDMYSEMIKSDIADVKNTGGRLAGAITAASFLKRFAGNYPWVHLDIAGPAWASKDKPYIPKGATGAGVRLLIEYLQNTQES